MSGSLSIVKKSINVSIYNNFSTYRKEERAVIFNNQWILAKTKAQSTTGFLKICFFYALPLNEKLDGIKIIFCYLINNLAK